MPSFRMGSATRTWFKKIHKTKPLQWDFDLYYLCVLLGLATGRSSAPEGATDVIDHFISDYTETQHLLLGLFVLAELQRRGISLDERTEVQRIVDELLAPNDPSGLSVLGMTKLNEYASGGHDYLVEKYGKSPQYVEAFLEKYNRVLGEAVSRSGSWSELAEQA